MIIYVKKKKTEQCLPYWPHLGGSVEDMLVRSRAHRVTNHRLNESNKGLGFYTHEHTLVPAE